MSFTKEDHERFAFIKEFEDLRTSDHYLLYKKLRRTRLVLYAYRHNIIELRNAIAHFHTNVVSYSFWSNASPYLRWNTQKRITTHIFNYLNSASSIIDISRIHSREHLTAAKLQSLEKHITTVFVNTIQFAFLRDLRNYIAHYSLLDIGVHSNWNYLTGQSNMIHLSKSRLLEWARWNKKSSDFLNAQDEKIYIEPILTQYHDHFISTQDEMFIGMVERYSEELYQLVSSMEQILKDAETFRMVDSIPYRRSTLRYLKYLLRIAQKSK